MPFQVYLDTATAEYVEIENLLARIEAGELEVARDVEAELREILADFDTEVRYTNVATKGPGARFRGDRVVSFSSAETREARRRALRRLDLWEAEALRRFRAANFEQFRLQGRVLAEMREVQARTTDAWTNIIRRLSNQDDFTPAQVAEAKRLSRDTAALRRKFGDFNAFLEDVTGDASTGKAENILAMVERGTRDAKNFVDLWGRGAPAGEVGRPVESVPDYRVMESTRRELLEFQRNFQFNRNTLRLSAVSHARGLANAAMIAIAQSIGVFHFMFVVTPDNRLRAKGVTRDELFQVRIGQVLGGHVPIESLIEVAAEIRGETVEDVEAEVQRRAERSPEPTHAPQTRRDMVRRLILQAEPDNVLSWPERFERASQERQLTVPWGSTLPIHPNSFEWYLPIPGSVLPDARSFASEQRRAA